MQLSNTVPSPRPPAQLPRAAFVSMGYAPPRYQPFYAAPAPSRLPAELGAARKSLGAGAWSWDEFPLSIFMATAGVGAMYGAGILPDPVKTLGYVAGVGLIGYAIYNVFTGPPAGQTMKAVAKNVPTDISPVEAFSMITGKIDSPTADGPVSFLTGKYDLQVTISNSSPKPVTFILQVVASEQARAWMWWRNTPLVDVVASDDVTIPAGKTQTLTFTPTLRSSRFTYNWFLVNLKLQKIRVAGEDPVALDQVTVELSTEYAKL